jgi:hypothetical protein
MQCPVGGDMPRERHQRTWHILVSISPIRVTSLFSTLGGRRVDQLQDHGGVEESRRTPWLSHGR